VSADNSLTAQERYAAELPEFEGASVRPNDSSVPHMVGVKVYPGGRVVISAVPLKALSSRHRFSIAILADRGGDGWTEKDDYSRGKTSRKLAIEH
jgi:hypothetical protein